MMGYGMAGAPSGYPPAPTGQPVWPGFGYGFGPGMGPGFGGMAPPVAGGFPGGFGMPFMGPAGFPGMFGGMMAPMPFGGGPFFGPGFAPWQIGPGYWPYTWPAFGVPPSDEQIREMIYDAIDADPLVPYDSDINVEVTGGVVTLTGTVPSKRIKHAIGDDAWWIPGVWDINNNIQVVPRKERVAAEGAAAQPAGGRAGR